MVTILLLQVLISLICSLAGLLFYVIVFKVVSTDERPFIFYLLTGLVIITLFSQIAVLFIPVNNYFSIVLTMTLVLTGYWRRKQIFPFYRAVVNSLKKQPPLQLLLMVAAGLTIIMLNAGPTMMDDTESYHIQMVKWSAEYGSVPGLVNLHFRYGFNSSWFTSISFFLPGSGSPNFFTTLNGAISAWFCFFVVGQLSRGVQSDPRHQISSIQVGVLLVLLLSLFCWPMLRGNGSTANYDFITTVMVAVLFIELIQQGKNVNAGTFAPEFILWPVYLFTVRIINYPLLLIAAFGMYLLIQKKEWRRFALLFSLSALLILPFIARNVILAGYPFYPSTAFNLFNVDWKADDEMIVWLKNYIKYYNRVYEGLLSIEETQKLIFPDWVYAWFRYMAFYDKPVVIAGVSGLAISTVLYKRASRILSPAVRYFILVFCLQLLSWFIIAPDARFVYGCLLCGVLLLPVILMKQQTIHVNRRAMQTIFISLSAVVIFYAVSKAAKNPSYQNLVWPRELPRPLVQEVKVDGIKMYIPEKISGNWNARCFGTDLPCLYILHPKLRARGHNIADGFRLEK